MKFTEKMTENFKKSLPGKSFRRTAWVTLGLYLVGLSLSLITVTSSLGMFIISFATICLADLIVILLVKKYNWNPWISILFVLGIGFLLVILTLVVLFSL